MGILFILKKNQNASWECLGQGTFGLVPQMLRFIQPTLCMDCKQKQSSKITVKKLCTGLI